MEIALNLFFIILCVAAVLLVIARIHVHFFFLKAKKEYLIAKKKEEELLAQMKRNNDVYHFQMHLIDTFDEGILKFLPPYEEMLNSDRPLVAREWINIDDVLRVKCELN